MEGSKQQGAVAIKQTLDDERGLRICGDLRLNMKAALIDFGIHLELPGFSFIILINESSVEAI